MTDPNLICIGAIMGAFGVKGELRVKSFCANPADLDQYGPLSNEDGSQSYELRITRAVKGGYAARIKNIRYRDQAEALKGTALYVAREKLPSLPDDEFYHTDLIGLTVLDTGGEAVGKIKTILNHGAGDILEISGSTFKAPVLLPFTKAAVPTIDLEAGRIIIDPPDGVLPE